MFGAGIDFVFKDLRLEDFSIGCKSAHHDCSLKRCYRKAVLSDGERVKASFVVEKVVGEFPHGFIGEIDPCFFSKREGLRGEEQIEWGGDMISCKHSEIDIG